MKYFLQYIKLFLLVFAGFLISGALSPSILEGSNETSDGLESLQPPPPPPPSPPPAAPTPVPARLSLTRGSAVDLSTSSRKLLGSDDKYDRFLFAQPDGTIYFMDGPSMVPRWKFVTGSPLVRSKQVDPDMEYFIDFGENGQLYEYSKAFGRRELNSTLEELVHEAAVTENSCFTFGSKETTLHFLNETNGNLLSRHRLPATRVKGGAPLVEEKLVASRPGAADGYIMLVRTDYSLSSIALPTDPAQIIPDAEEPLWQLSRSHIRAIYIKDGQSSNMGDKLVLSSRSQTDMPVYVLPMGSEERGAIDGDLKLPPAFYSYHEKFHNKKPLMLPDSPAVAKNIAVTVQSPFTRSDRIQALPDDRQSSSGSSNNLPEAAKYLLGYTAADKPSIGKVSCEPVSFQSQSSENFPNENMSSIPLNLHKDTSSHIVRKDYAATMSSNELLTGVIYENFAWIGIPFLLIILMLWLFKLRVAVNNDEQLDKLKEKKSTSPKKRKARKAGNMKNGALVSNSEKVTSSVMEKAETNGCAQAQNYQLHSSDGYYTSLDAGSERRVGKLLVSNSEIGRGSNGTVVLEGVYSGRPVAVKRLLRAHHDVADKEIRYLIASDQHPNIVRYYGHEEDVDFVYMSLERCTCSLSDLIQLCSDSSPHSAASGNHTSISTKEHKVSLYEKGISKDLELWRADGFPSPQLIKLARDVVAGLAHLHELGIIHRDMKPQNVLISTGRSLNAKLSDMGISKRLLEDMSSISHHATGCGSSGWQAPEQLLHGRQTRAVDLFSLGCVLFFCITKGRHPFGNYFERDSNIVNNHIDLFLVDHIPEAVNLLSQLLDPNPDLRPTAVKVLNHPFFWNSEMRLTFLRDTSDRVELEDRESESELLKALENVAPVMFGGKWGEKLDAALITDLSRYRKYKFECTRDLLRVIRNKLNHFSELSDELKKSLGPVPEGFDRYFSSRFPNLMIEVYKVVCGYCSNEDWFNKKYS